jgi:signal transduction histidine kinase
MVSSVTDGQQAAANAAAWQGRAQNLKTRAYAASQREFAALSRTEAAASRDEAARMRAEAARIRDDGARTRDEGARVRDSAAVVRDQAARARDLATRLREESLRARITSGEPLDRAGWAQLLDLDQQASAQSHAAARHDREAAELDRRAAERDREAAEHDRRAAARDRDAAEKDRDAADEDRRAADADRAAAEADRQAAEREVGFAEDWVTRADRLISLGRLTSTLAHELNTPITTLRLLIEAMRLEKNPTAFAPMLDDAGAAIEQMSVVVADVRRSMASTSESLAAQPTDLASVVELTRRLTSGEVNRVARFLAEVEPGVRVMGVAPRLGQVLTNLVLNAVEAMVPGASGNELRVVVRSVDGRARIEVQDTGAGIAPEVLPHLFEAFFTTRSETGGTGLGLALSKRIIEEHLGTLSVRSTPGVGTVFTIDLPLLVESPPAIDPRR